MKAAVIGHPISHSKSPVIHQYWMDKNDIEGSYKAIDIDPKNLKNGINQLIEEGYNGFNVTVPFKTDIIKYCDILDEGAKKIAAVNTVVIEQGKLKGINTDAFGFIANIKAHIPDIIFTGKTALVLGAGGAARAVIYGLIEQGVERIKLFNRTKSTAEALKEMYPDYIDVFDWKDREKQLETADFFVNTTSLGMKNMPPLDIDLTALSKEAVVVDIVYAPLMTALLEAAENRGNTIVTGIGMLIHQARPAFKAWTGIMPEDSKELQRQVLS